MVRYPESTKHSLESRLGRRASARWPQLASIAVRHRANFTYVDGVLPDDQRRGGVCCTLVKENYVYEALQGAVATAYLLHRQGYDTWNWGNQAIKRAFLWETNVNGFPATSEDTWEPWLVNKAYGLKLAAPCPSKPGKNFGYTDWFAAAGA